MNPEQRLLKTEKLKNCNIVKHKPQLSIGIRFHYCSSITIFLSCRDQPRPDPEENPDLETQEEREHRETLLHDHDDKDEAMKAAAAAAKKEKEVPVNLM